MGSYIKNLTSVGLRTPNLLGQQNPPHSQQICWVSFSPDPAISSGFLPARAISSHARPSRPLARHFSPARAARVRSTPSILHSTSCASVPRFPRRAATSAPCESPCEVCPPAPRASGDFPGKMRPPPPVNPLRGATSGSGDSPIEGTTEVVASWSFRARAE